MGNNECFIEIAEQQNTNLAVVAPELPKPYSQQAWLSAAFSCFFIINLLRILTELWLGMKVLLMNFQQY